MTRGKEAVPVDVHIVAVDPGKEKCGVAVVSEDGKVLAKKVVARRELFEVLAGYVRDYGRFKLVLGDRTGSKAFLEELEGHRLLSEIDGVHTVDEHLSSLEARDRYFSENPPTGLRRLIPRTMQVPPVPYDDYVAVILAERYLSRDQ